MLYFYKAGKVVLIILRQNKKRFQQILWDTETDTFTCGQWLLHVQLDFKRSLISPCGRYFYYTYNKHTINSKTYIIVSEIPYFTAILFSDDGIGRYVYPNFTIDGNPIIYDNGYSLISKKQNNFQISHLHLTQDEMDQIWNIRKESQTKIKHELNITVDGDIIFRDGKIIYDASNNKFENIIY